MGVEATRKMNASTPGLGHRVNANDRHQSASTPSQPFPLQGKGSDTLRRLEFGFKRSAWILLSTALGVLATSAVAQTEAISERPDRAGVVIYRDRPVDTAALLVQSQQPWNNLNRQGLALIVERRTIDLPAGEGIVRFRGVATGIVSQSATLDGLPATVVERNTDFDILSPGSLLQKSVGEVVRIVRTNPVTGEAVEKSAVVRSGPNGTVLEIDGRFEALSCSGLTERIIFDRLPEGLSDQPVLSVRTRAPQAGRYTVTLAYLATGLQWSADYVARLNPDGRTLALEGWLTLANFGGTGFPDAPVQVVAGDLRRDGSTVPIDAPQVAQTPECWPLDTTTGVVLPAPPPPPAPPAAPRQSMMRTEGAMADEIVVTGSRITQKMAEQGELGDYKIYTLPEPTTVAARQTKQVRFLDQPSVTYDRVYRATAQADSDPEPVAPTLLLRARNDRRAGLGLALPGGGVSLIETSEGRPLFAGQARFEDKAVGLPVELEMGEAMGVSVATRSQPPITAGEHTRQAFEVTARNDKTETVEVEIVPDGWFRRGFRILNPSQRSRIGDGGYPVWTLTLAPGESRTLRYTVQADD